MTKWNYVYDFQPEFMLGKIPKAINAGRDEIIFTFDDGSSCMFYHEQDCCECVTVEDVNGDWLDLLGHPLLVAEERVNTERDCETWTFYTFRSIGGSVDVRWYGYSNGYYSERVDFAISGGE